MDHCEVKTDPFFIGWYQVSRFLGSGTYGQVLKGCDCVTGQVVAIKILRREEPYAQQGALEASILRRLSEERAERFNIVKSCGSFMHQNHLCLVFEMLQESLFDFMKRRNFAPLPLQSVRSVVQQVSTALVKLKSLGLIHGDLKPENIMLVDPVVQPYRVKVIDFGLACYTSEALCGVSLQTRFYRAPEIILGLPFNEAIDMWSLGCTAAELFLGQPLYPGASEYDQIRRICFTQRLPPEHLLNAGTKTGRYFCRGSGPDNSGWRLKTFAEYRPESSVVNPFCLLHELHEIILINKPNLVEKEEMVERVLFVDLLDKMLKLEAELRITPTESLEHLFVTMSHPSPHDLPSVEVESTPSTSVQSFECLFLKEK